MDRGARAVNVVLTLVAIAAIVTGIWAWSQKGSAQPASATVTSILLTEATAAGSPGSNVHVESRVFVTRAKTWALYWSYFCLIPGQITTWHTRLALQQLDSSGRPMPRPRVLYSATSKDGPVSYAQYYRLQGPGAFRFIVDTTHHCAWSLRAPPVAGPALTS